MIMKLHHILSSVLLAILALGSFTSCDKDLWEFEDKNKGSYKPLDGEPLATTIYNHGGYDEFVHLLHYSETYPVLNALYDGSNKPNTYTLFVPTDEALRRFYSQKGVTSIEELGVDYARAMVRTMTHDADSLKLTELFGAGVDWLELPMVAGEVLNLTIDTTQVGFLINDSIHISRDYVKCSNGFFYMADGLVSPLVESVYDRIVTDGRSHIMTEALRATGYDRELATCADTTYVLGVRHIIRRHYTFLNVTDEVFAKNGIQSLDALRAALLANASDKGVGADSLLRQYVEYHLFNADYTSSDLLTMVGADTVRIWSTVAANQILMVTRHGEPDQTPVFSINDDDTRILASSDVRARNGYLHQLSGWMPVYEPKQSTVVWDLADYPDVRNSLGVEYQPSAPVSSERKFDISKLDCYKVEVGPGGVGGNTYSSLCYVTCKSNLKGCQYNDRVVFNLGYQGSVSMNTPTLVKGRYRVSISMAYLVEHSFIRTSNGCKGGLIKLTVDGEHQILTAPYTSITKSLAGVYETELYDEIEFTETGSHLFKFVIMDPAATSNSKFSLQFDAITFTPIE